ncbi:MAG: MFS transporter [Cyanobacteria bacterium P01_H01_bin.130]
MRTFIILWLGQLASSLGSAMTYFALTLWMWQQTQSATAIALIVVFYQLPQIAITPLSGILVDRISRKTLLGLSDTGAACCTVAIGILSAFQLLQVWHIYLIASIIGCMGNIQSLTYTTVIPTLVPKQHHTRAGSMGALLGYGAAIIAPALAGMLYPHIALPGITAIDGVTFMIAIATLIGVKIPRPPQEPVNTSDPERQKLWGDLTFGFRYIAAHPNLLAMVAAMSSFSFLNQISETLYQPMVLARTGGNTQTLGIVVAAYGVGGVAGSLLFSIWGGLRSRPLAILVGFMGAGCSQILLGVSQLSTLWMAARLGAAFCAPLRGSAYMAVWYAKVEPKFQGRVFSADYLIGTVVLVLANRVAGPLADRLFEPWMQYKITPLTPLFGSTPGSGMALLQVLLGVGIVAIGAIGLVVIQQRRRKVP